MVNGAGFNGMVKNDYQRIQDGSRSTKNSISNFQSLSWIDADRDDCHDHEMSLTSLIQRIPQIPEHCCLRSVAKNRHTYSGDPAGRHDSIKIKKRRIFEKGRCESS